MSKLLSPSLSLPKMYLEYDRGMTDTGTSGLGEPCNSYVVHVDECSDRF